MEGVLVTGTVRDARSGSACGAWRTSRSRSRSTCRSCTPTRTGSTARSRTRTTRCADRRRPDRPRARRARRVVLDLPFQPRVPRRLPRTVLHVRCPSRRRTRQHHHDSVDPRWGRCSPSGCRRPHDRREGELPWPSPSGRCPAATRGPAARSGRRRATTLTTTVEAGQVQLLAPAPGPGRHRLGRHPAVPGVQGPQGQGPLTPTGAGMADGCDAGRPLAPGAASAAAAARGRARPGAAHAGADPPLLRVRERRAADQRAAGVPRRLGARPGGHGRALHAATPTCPRGSWPSCGRRWSTCAPWPASPATSASARTCCSAAARRPPAAGTSPRSWPTPSRR